MDVLLDEAPCGFLIFNDEGVITQANKTLEIWLGFTSGELIGNKLESLLSIAGRIFYQTHFFPLLKLHGKAEEIFLTLRSKALDDVPVLVNATRREHNNVTQNHCVLLPVYQRKKYEEELLNARRTAEQALNNNERLLKATEELEHSKQELDRQVTRLSWINEDLVEFSHVISHDIQEPIRKIAMFADMIDRENHSQLTPLSKMSVEKINSASRKMRDLISCLQQYVSVDAISTTTDHCNLTKIITAARVQAMIDSRFENVTVNTGSLPSIEGHCGQLQLLFYHLISNSIQFRKEATPPEITIEADIIQENSFQTTEEKYKYIDFARITYTDNGKGFSNDYKDYVFQLFKKVHVEATGLGFGLALCRKIVKNHYGSITARSSKDGGTTFTILLPAGESTPVETPAPALESVGNL